jgi:hypothetical protein
VLPLYGFSRSDKSGGLVSGVEFLFYIGPGIVAYTLLAIYLCKKLFLRSWLFSPLLSIFATLLFISEYGVWLNGISDLRIVIIAFGIFVYILLTVLLIELPRVSGKAYWKSLFIFFLVMLGMAGIQAGIGHIHDKRQTDQRVSSYHDIAFPVYYPDNETNTTSVSAYLSKSGMGNGTVIEFESQTYDAFSESKYTGLAPADDCGTSYGEIPTDPTVWQCSIIDQTSSYALYREKTIYSNPNANTPYDYLYFAIFNNQTVVWYNVYGSDTLLPSTTEPLVKVEAFFNSLMPVNLHSAFMTQILGNDSE